MIGVVILTVIRNLNINSNLTVKIYIQNAFKVITPRSRSQQSPTIQMWKRWIEIRFSNRLAIIKPFTFTQERWETHNGASSVWWTSFARLSSPPRNWCENRCHNWEKLLESLKLRMEVFNSARPSRNRNVTRSSNESRNAYRIAHKNLRYF